MDAWIAEKILSLVGEDEYSVAIIAEHTSLLDNPKLKGNLRDIFGFLLVGFFESHDSFPQKEIIHKGCMEMYGASINAFDTFLSEPWRIIQATLIFSKPAVKYSRELNLYLLKDFKSNSTNYLGLLHKFGG